MTDRINALTVVLEADIREDDAEPLIAAIRQMRGVLAVDGHVRTIEAHIERARATNHVRRKLMDLLAELNER